MAKPEAVLAADLLAFTLAVESEREGVTVEMLVQGVPLGQATHIIARAQQLRTILTELRRELHARAAVHGFSQQDADEAFRTILMMMRTRRSGM